MAQTAKVQEPSMEEILASIRRIIADDETKARSAEPPKPVPSAPPPRPAPPPAPAAAARHAAPPSPPPAAAAMNQDDIDTMLSSLDAPAASSPGKQDAADVLELSESMTVGAAAPQPPVFRTIEGHSDVFFSEEIAEQPAPESAAKTMESPRHPAAPSQEAPLMSSSTSAAVDHAFGALAQTVLVQNARTLEDLVKEMMRPMLKAWLDDNLPGLVERVVRAEIERVSRGRTG